MSPYLITNVIIMALAIGTILVILHMFVDVKSIGKRIKYRMEMKKKCLNTKPCHCCAYWNVRKDFCALESQLRAKYKITD